MLLPILFYYLSYFTTYLILLPILFYNLPFLHPIFSYNLSYFTTYLIYKLFLKNGIESGIPTVMAIDALLGGIDTTGEMFV
jgi:hypothetical protein